MISLERIHVKVSHGTRKVPWLTLLLGILTAAFHLAGPPVFEFLVFDKKAVLHGEIWRFFTGHFVHFGLEHFFWDFLAFIILSLIVEWDNVRKLAESFLVCCVFVSAWLMSGGGGIDTYCGLSGILSGLLVVAAVTQYQRTANKVFLGVLFLMAGKIMFEFFTGSTLFVSSVQGVPGAHAMGFAAGGVYLVTRSGFKTVNN